MTSPGEIRQNLKCKVSQSKVRGKLVKMLFVVEPLNSLIFDTHGKSYLIYKCDGFRFMTFLM